MLERLKALKLLTPQQNKDASREQELRQILRNQELEKITKATLLKFNNAQAEFNAMLAENRNKWASEEREHEERVKQRQQELEALGNVETMAELLQDRLDEVGEREQNVLRREQAMQALEATLKGLYPHI